MRVEFRQTGGGVVYFRRPPSAVTIDVGMLAEEERRALEQLVTDARFFELPSRVPAPRGAPEAACHITIEDRGRQHSISVNDPFPGPALQRLIDRLRTIAGC